MGREPEWEREWLRLSAGARSRLPDQSRCEFFKPAQGLPSATLLCFVAVSFTARYSEFDASLTSPPPVHNIGYR